MANEIAISLNATVTNGYLKHSIQPGSLSFDQAAIGAHAPVVSVTTSEMNLATGDISTLGWLFMRNLDDTNYVTWGVSTSTGASMSPAVGRMETGEIAALRLNPGATIRMLANTAACKVQVWLFED